MEDFINIYGPPIMLGILGSLMAYTGYREMNPTIDDLREKSRRQDEQSKYNILIGSSNMKHENWEKRCLEAGKILDK